MADFDYQYHEPIIEECVNDAVISHANSMGDLITTLFPAAHMILP
jgi:hypothetical protein